MDKKKVIIISLLIVAVVLSTASVVMNVAVFDKMEINEASPQPDAANLKLTIEQTEANSPEAANGIG